MYRNKESVQSQDCTLFVCEWDRLLLYDTDIVQGLTFARPFVDKALCLIVGDGDGCSVTGSKDFGVVRVAHEGEVGEVCTLAILVVAVHVTVVHENPLVRTDELEYCRAFYCLIALLQVFMLGSPLAAQSLGGSLLNAVALTFGLEEHMVHAVCIHDVCIDGVGIVVIEYLGHANLSEVFIGV